jgi:hypothetical protein
MTHEGMWSLVCANYGTAPMGSLIDIGVHQRQAGRWVAVEDKDESFIIVPDILEVPHDD